MKEKRYYCDWALWALNSSNEKDNRLVSKVLLISLVVVTAISSLIYYNIMMHNPGEYLEAYSESAYQYLDEITDNIIGKDGIKEVAIPEDVVEQEITYEEYIKSHKIGFYIWVAIFGVLTWMVMTVAIGMVMAVAIPISMFHKKKDMKENLS